MQRNGPRCCGLNGSVAMVLFCWWSTASAASQVYECRVNGQRVFGDQPCAADAAQREITVTNQLNAREAAIGYRSAAAPARRNSARAEANFSTERQARCAKLANDRSELLSRQRAGYSHAQGERLRERLRKTDAEYYQLRCSSRR